ncbi:MAG: Fe-S cluster assembly ATPase SufC [Patescibacteria group bacterium]
MLTLKNLSVSVAKKKILSDLSYTFEKGKIYAVMGPNGSGKSTLAYSIMAHPTYKVKGGIFFKKEDVSDLDAQKRSEKGIFLSFQSPLSLSGVTVLQLLQLALSGKKEPLAIRKETIKYAKELGISEELLTRSLNEGSSGGEKKKFEVLQAAVLDKQVCIFDEIDTGVDIDSLKKISKFLKKYKGNKTFILITHYNRILKYLKPDNVLVLVNGKLVKVGTAKLAEAIEKKGYENIVKRES